MLIFQGDETRTESEVTLPENVDDSQVVKEGDIDSVAMSGPESSAVQTEFPTKEISASVENDKVLIGGRRKVDEINKQETMNQESCQMDNTQVAETSSAGVMMNDSPSDEDIMEISEDYQTIVSKDMTDSSSQGTENVEMIDITKVVSNKVTKMKPISQKDGYDDDMDSESELVIDETKNSSKESQDKETDDDDKEMADGNNKNVATGDDKSYDTDNDIEDNLMIIDVRSLTDNTEIINFDKSDNVAVEKTGTGYTDNNKSLHEEQNAELVDKASEEQIFKDVTVDKPQSSSSSKSKRKSPNSVRRITDLADTSDNVLPEATENSSLLTNPNTTSTSVMSNRHVSEDLGVPASQSTSIVAASVSESLPVISNTFSMKGTVQSSITVKDEPPDDGMYGVMQSYTNSAQMQNPTIASFKSTSMTLAPGNAVIHKGHILSQRFSTPFKVGRPPNTQKLVISKVPPIVCPTIAAVSMINSAPASLVRYPLSTVVTQTSLKVQAASQSKSSSGKNTTIVTLRNLAPRSAAPAVAQNGVLTVTSTAPSKTKESTPKNLSTINIHSVGVARITDLIARKNPIPTFKPDPIPDYLKSVQSSKLHPCYECGDSFHFEKSLRQHLGRCSMNIYYKCEKCVSKLKFTNKCQLLSHLRSHLNIEKTQAVPIHIKSDSIEIVTNFNAITADKPFEWYKEGHVGLPVSKVAGDHAAVSGFQCMECQKVFTNSNLLQDHVKGSISEFHFCNECPIYVNSKCALQAHKKLHMLDEVKTFKSLTVNQWRLLKSLSCPECGKHFSDSSATSLLYDMALHLKNSCFHLSRLPAYKCTKCLKVFQNFEGLRNHLNTRLEHYYKCGLCPMALKSLKSLESHYDMKHKMSDNVEAKPGMSDKIIYRCHICDTLIDDKSFLVQHIDKHLEECKKHPETHYHCLQCGQMFMQRKDLAEHYSKHSWVRRQFWCTFCSKDKVKAITYINHMLTFHTATRSHLASKSIVKFCNKCGLVCVGEHMFQTHACLAARNTTVIVGDRSEQKGGVTKTKHQGRKESGNTAEILPKDLPSNVSKTCLACSEVFNSPAQRESHLKDHRDVDMIFICKFCDKMNFKSYHQLRSHEIACKAMLDMPKDLLIDKKKKEVATPYRRIRSKAEIQQQRKTASSVATETESYVDGVELTPKDNSKSRRNKEAVEYFNCDKCDAVFTRKSKQEEHVKSEHGIHPCHLCGLMHESQSSLRKHLMVDHEGKRMLLYCGVCKNRKIDKAFNVRGKLIKHLKVKHRMKVIDESKIITQLPGLPETGKETTPEAQKRKLSVSPETSVKKLRIEGESDFKCAKCLFTCSVKSEFRQHILEHKAAETYQCFECGLCFAVLPSLRKHLFMVHKVKDFDSYMAENEIEEPTVLEDNDVDIIREPQPDKREEMEESSEEEPSGDPLECKVCYRSFDNEKILKSHMRTHGMAFIKKSRRRAQNIAPSKKAENEVAYSSSQDEGKQEGLVLKLRRLKPVNDEKDNLKIVDASTSVDDAKEVDVVGEEAEQMDTETVITK